MTKEQYLIILGRFQVNNLKRKLKISEIYLTPLESPSLLDSLKPYISSEAHLVSYGVLMKTFQSVTI